MPEAPSNVKLNLPLHPLIFKRLASLPPISNISISSSSTPSLPPSLTPASAVVPITISEDDADEQARAYARTEGAEDATQQFLLSIGQSIAPQLDAHTDKWVPKVVGATSMFYNGATKVYKCAFCDFQQPTALGVATHTGKYYAKKIDEAENG